MNSLKWVKLKKYCEMSGDTEDAFKAKRRRRLWLIGVHFTKALDGCIYINTQEVTKWLESPPNMQSLAA